MEQSNHSGFRDGQAHRSENMINCQNSCCARGERAGEGRRGQERAGNGRGVGGGAETADGKRVAALARMICMRGAALPPHRTNGGRAAAQFTGAAVLRGILKAQPLALQVHREQAIVDKKHRLVHSGSPPRSRPAKGEARAEDARLDVDPPCELRTRRRPPELKPREAMPRGQPLWGFLAKTFILTGYCLAVLI